MPELPEVEIIRRELKKNLIGDSIVSIKILYKPIINGEIKQIINKKILDINRNGKYLIVKFAHANLLIHLRMTGQILFDSKTSDKKHIHLIAKTKKGKTIIYRDIRKFGKWQIVEEININNGTDALAKLDPTKIKDKFKHKQIAIKKVLLDQKIIAGIGNIYADEILNCAQVNPYTLASSLNINKINNICNCTHKILYKSIKLGGSSMSDFINTKGEKGNYLNSALAYRKEGNKCHNCSGKIIKNKISGRATYYCPSCQK